MIMEAKYKDLKFENEAKFKDWLNKTATQLIQIEDAGQDFLQFWIDECGEILHTAPFGGHLWNGTFVDLKKLHLVKPLQLKGVTGYENGYTMAYSVVKIQKLR